MRYHEENPQITRYRKEAENSLLLVDDALRQAKESQKLCRESQQLCREAHRQRDEAIASSRQYASVLVQTVRQVVAFNNRPWYKRLFSRFNFAKIELPDVAADDVPCTETQPATEAGGSRKNDRADGKLRWELLPLSLVRHIVAVYSFGATKYAPNTWQELPDGYDRYKAALFRHIDSYESGELVDPESRLHPLAHAAWNALAMLYFALKKHPS